MPRLTLRWLGQAGFLLSVGSTRILIDPWLSAHALRASRPPAIDDLPDGIGWLLASHEHPDHLDLASLPALLDRYPGLEVVVPAPLRQRVASTDGRAHICCVQPGDSMRAGDVTVHVVHAWHGVKIEDGYSNGYGLRGVDLTPFVGFVLRTSGPSIYHAGDTVAGVGLADEVKALGVDIALLPVNGRDAVREAAGILGNLDAREAVAFATSIGAGLMVPMHHDMVRGNRTPVGRVVEAAHRAKPPLSVLVPAMGVDLGIGITR
ncbi:MAG: MBL fold metallo-hydrolase [Candidatus Limnocylindrales bacterium]